MSRTRRRDPGAPHRARPGPDREPPCFRCRRCGLEVGRDAPGTRHRNHCPFCLWSLHVDERPGDRASACGGGMEPIAVWVRPDGEWALVHRCGSCHQLRVNRTAGDDDATTLLALAAWPLAHPPFPLRGRRS